MKNTLIESAIGILIGFMTGVILMVTFLILKPEIFTAYKQGYEAGKNWKPESMTKANSNMVVYFKGYPQITDQVKMQRDSVQIVIDSFMGKPKRYLLMTLKLITKER